MGARGRRTELRSLRYRGESGEHQQSGELTQIEQSLSVAGADAVISEDDVFAVAGAWSIDPTRLGEHGTEAPSAPGGRCTDRVSHVQERQVPALPRL